MRRFYFEENRSNHRRCSVRKGVLRNFAKFTGKHLCQSLLFNKIAGCRSLSNIYQLNNYITNNLSPYLCGYRKGYNVQQALVSLIKKWKKILDDKGFGVAILTNLSNTFDILNHKLLIAKLHACRFKRDSFKLINNYLSNR